MSLHCAGNNVCNSCKIYWTALKLSLSIFHGLTAVAIHIKFRWDYEHYGQTLVRRQALPPSNLSLQAQPAFTTTV